MALTTALLALLGAGMWSAHRGQTPDRTWGLVFSPDGRLLAVQGDEMTTIYRQPGDGDPLAISGRWKAAFNPDGRSVALAGGGRVFLARTSDWATVDDWPVYNEITNLAFSPGGGELTALGAHSGHMWLWETTGGEDRVSVQAHGDGAFAVAFSPDGTLIATGGCPEGTAESQIRLWSAEDGGLVQEIMVPRHAYVRQLLFTDAGEHLMAALSDGGANLMYDIRDLDSVALVAADPLTRITGRVVLSADGRLAAFGTSDSARWWAPTIHVIDRASGSRVMSTRGLRSTYSCWDVVFKPGGQRVGVATADGVVSDWDLSTGQRVASTDGYRAPRWSWHWLASAGAAIAWLLAWVGITRVRDGILPSRDRLLVPACGGAAAACIAVLNWSWIADPWARPDPIGLFTLLGVFEIGALVLMVCVGVITHARQALITALLAYPPLILVTATLWARVVASV
jgi:WD40 repeat protein